MFEIPRLECMAEYKELTAKRVLNEQSVGAVAKDLGLNERAQRNWVKNTNAAIQNSGHPALSFYLETQTSTNTTQFPLFLKKGWPLPLMPT